METSKINTISELEQTLPTNFKVRDYLEKFDYYSRAFGNMLNMYDEILTICPDFDMSKFFISDNVYAKKMRDGYEYLTIKECKEEYHRILAETPSRLFNLTLKHIGKEKSFKKIESLIIANLGELEASKRVLKQAYKRAYDSYDRNLTMDEYFKTNLKMWHDHKDVYYIKGVGSGMTAIRTVRNSELKEYITSL